MLAAGRLPKSFPYLSSGSSLSFSRHYHLRQPPPTPRITNIDVRGVYSRWRRQCRVLEKRQSYVFTSASTLYPMTPPSARLPPPRRRLSIKLQLYCHQDANCYGGIALQYSNRPPLVRCSSEA
ncbi:hypothetical protein E2C01_004167 [Portunus trituberculatus]|uniref:Uncharacterized protein n=1 Tax=Portunus trituberculatus TaxID=210409 RepID=A0A5B7CPS7_PORTR|nr:hypothetical protein [Portunus trituberculatus]